MGNPRTLKVNLNEYGYYMELDVRKDDCNRESAHWHLCKNGRRIGQISAYGTWTSRPAESSSIIREAEELTRSYSSTIIEYYDYNRVNGAGY